VQFTSVQFSFVLVFLFFDGYGIGSDDALMQVLVFVLVFRFSFSWLLFCGFRFFL
jgi:hypothetical protein